MTADHDKVAVIAQDFNVDLAPSVKTVHENLEPGVNAVANLCRHLGPKCRSVMPGDECVWQMSVQTGAIVEDGFAVDVQLVQDAVVDLVVVDQHLVDLHSVD